MARPEEGRAAAGAHVVDAVGETEAADGRRAVAAADDREARATRHPVGDRTRTGREGRHLEHAHRPVPEEQRRVADVGRERGRGLGTDVEPLLTRRHRVGGHDPRLGVVGDLAPPSGGDILLLVNGFGATPPMELYLMYGSARRLLEAEGLRLSRSLVGSYCTSLDMSGCSLTVTALDDELRALWDAPVHTAALRW